jgi:hypothetical protein
MTRWSAITGPRRSGSALAYRSRSTATAETNSTTSYTTSRDATPKDSAKSLQRCGTRTPRAFAFDRFFGESADPTLWRDPALQMAVDGQPPHTTGGEPEPFDHLLLCEKVAGDLSDLLHPTHCLSVS